MSMESNSVVFEGDDLTALVSMMGQLLTFHEDARLRRLVVTIDDDFREGLKFKLGDVYPAWTRGFGKMAPVPERMAMDVPAKAETDRAWDAVRIEAAIEAAVGPACTCPVDSSVTDDQIAREDGHRTGCSRGEWIRPTWSGRTGIGPEPEAGDDDPRGWQG